MIAGVGATAYLWQAGPNSSANLTATTNPLTAKSQSLSAPVTNQVANAPTHSSAPEASQLPAHIKTALTRLEILAACAPESCGHTSTANDPRAAHFATADEVRHELETLLEAMEESPTPDPAVAQSVRQFMQYPDGHVQSSALAVLSALPADPATLDAVLTGLSQSNYDAPLFQQAMAELGRYPESQEKIDTLLGETLKTGDIQVAQTVATQLLPMLSTTNLDFYRTILTELPPRTEKATLLANTIAEYERRQTGG